MGLVVSVVCAAALQQLEVEPYPGLVGEPVTVTATRAAGPIPGLALQVELPDGSARAIGATDDQGRLVFVAAGAGQHVFRAVVDGVDVLAPHRIVGARRRWWFAIGTVPLGLALLWRLSRARGRRDP